jgi:hypothetical protein
MVTPNERYFFAASDDYAADKIKTLVAMGRSQTSGITSIPQFPDRSGPTSAVRDVLAAAIDMAPRSAPKPRERGEPTGPNTTHAGSFASDGETARRAGAEASVKGAMVVGALENVDAAYGPRTGSIVLVRLDPVHRAKLEGVILPMAWLPLTVLEQLVRVTDEVAGRGDGTTAEAIGRACADRELPTTHRMFMQSATPIAAIERVPQLHRSYFTRGEAKLLSSGPNVARLGFEGTGLESPVLTPWTGGFLARLLELSGARDVRVVPGRGDKGDERWSFNVRWR